MSLRAASLDDNGRSCVAETKAARFLAARACLDACAAAVLTQAELGALRKYRVKSPFREPILPRIALVTEQLNLSFIPDRGLGPPKPCRKGGRPPAVAAMAAGRMVERV